MQRWIKNTLILTPVLGAMGAAGYYLFEDYHKPKEESKKEAPQREIIGEVTFVSNNVKRKLDANVLWENLDKKTPLYVKDSVRTGENSYATIKFNDGNLLEVNENSLIVLERTTDKLLVDFKVGDITSRGQAKGLDIKVNESTITTDNADVQLQAAPGKDTDITVAKGKATLTDKEKKKIDLSQRQKATLDDKGNTQVQDIDVTLVSPENRASIKSQVAETKQVFTWEVHKEEIKEERLELSRSSKFLPNETKNYNAHQSLTAPLRQGTYFWRVGWKTKDKLSYTQARKLTVESDRNIELIFPEEDNKFSFEPEENKIDFSWTSKLKDASYVFELSQTQDFKNIAATATTKELVHKEEKLAAGSYYWRIKALDAKNSPVAESDVAHFGLQINLPKLPELVVPEEGAILDPLKALEFQWKAQEKAQSYRILITKDKERKDVVKTETTKEPLYLWAWKKQGDYFWSVTSLDEKGNPTGQSETRAFQVKQKIKIASIVLVNPAKGSTVIREKREKIDPVTFQWKPQKKMPGPYTFLFSREADMKKPSKKEGLQNQIFPLVITESGTIYWKIISTPKEAKTEEPKELEFSEVGHFEYKVITSLLPPLLVEPLNRAEIVGVEAQPQIFKWKPVETKGAQYHFILEKYDARTEERTPILDKVLKETQITSPPLQEGSYIWSVGTVDEQGNAGVQSKPRNLEVNFQEELSAPQLKAPVIK